MDNIQLIKNYWNDLSAQKWDNISNYFTKSAYINWHNTNEKFTVDEFVRINRAYPGKWIITVERLENFDNKVITACQVNLTGEDISFHAISFFELNDNKIISLDEYWGDDGLAPQWRRDLKIGTKI